MAVLAAEAFSAGFSACCTDVQGPMSTRAERTIRCFRTPSSSIAAVRKGFSALYSRVSLEAFQFLAGCGRRIKQITHPRATHRGHRHHLILRLPESRRSQGTRHIERRRPWRLRVCADACRQGRTFPSQSKSAQIISLTRSPLQARAQLTNHWIATISLFAGRLEARKLGRRTHYAKTIGHRDVLRLHRGTCLSVLPHL